MEIKIKVENQNIIPSEQELDKSLLLTISPTLSGHIGVDGRDGRDGANGIDGSNGVDGQDGVNGTNGSDGIDGINGEDGRNGVDGINGTDGASAYEIAVAGGFAGSHSQWLESLVADSEQVEQMGIAIEKRVMESVSSDVVLVDGQRYIPSAYFNPKQSLQSGLDSSNGWYRLNNGTLSKDKAWSIELLVSLPGINQHNNTILFTVGDLSEITVNVIFDDIITKVKLRSENHVCPNPKAVHIVLTHTPLHGVTVYYNGSPSKRILNYVSYTGSGFTLGGNATNKSPFKGMIHRLRVFEHALPHREVDALWNGGLVSNPALPAEFDLEQYPIVGEYLPSGVLADRWIDSSTGGRDLIAIGTPRPSYRQAKDLDYIKRHFFEELEYLNGEEVYFFSPPGYMGYMIVIKNGSDVAFDSVNLQYGASGLVNMGSVAPLTQLSYVVPSGTPKMGDAETWVFYIETSASNGGLEIIVYYKWVGIA